MIRRFNYTNRRKLDRSRISIAVNEAQWTFRLELAVTDIGLPPSAPVFLDAYTSSQIESVRFALGTLDALSQNEFSLEGVSPGAPRFDVYIVDPSDDVGRILAVARGVPPQSGGGQEETSQESLLPVNPCDLGDEIWRVSFAHSRPWLEVNNKIPQVKQILQGDNAFFALVYPAVIRQVLTHILIETGTERDADDEGSWQQIWLRWGIRWHPQKAEPPQGDDEAEGDADARAWIDDVVAGFCSVKSIREQLIASLSLEGE